MSFRLMILGSGDMQPNVAFVPTSQHHLDSNTISTEDVARWKQNLNPLHISNTHLVYVVDWAREVAVYMTINW